MSTNVEPVVAHDEKSKLFIFLPEITYGKPGNVGFLLEIVFVDAVLCKVTKETLEANKIMRNAIDLTSLTFQWSSSRSRQSIFSTILGGSQQSPS